MKSPSKASFRQKPASLFRLWCYLFSKEPVELSLRYLHLPAWGRIMICKTKQLMHRMQHPQHIFQWEVNLNWSLGSVSVCSWCTFSVLSENIFQFSFILKDSSSYSPRWLLDVNNPLLKSINNYTPGYRRTVLTKLFHFAVKLAEMPVVCFVDVFI